MIETLVNFFTVCGDLLMGSSSSLFGISPIISTSSTLAESLDDDPEATTSTLISTSLTSASMNGCSSADTPRVQVQDTQMIVESMSLEELYELRDEVCEKSDSLKLHM